MIRRTFAITLATCTAVSIASSALAAPEAGLIDDNKPSATPQQPTITWGECGNNVSLPWGSECGQMTAPLDYSNPDGEQVTLVMARIKAFDQENRKGTIFINPGGPGGSAVKAVRQFADALSEDVQNTYDIVGLDPRGTGYSEAFTCGNYPDGPDVPVFPIKPGDGALILTKESEFRKACEAANPRIGRYMTTADLARDLDRARQAVGDEKINFIGTSYGTYVAATYANMSPNNIRTMVADSAIDPIAYRDGRGASRLTSPVFARLGGVYGAQKAINAALTDCENAGQSKCAYARSIRKSWESLHTPKGRAATYTYMGSRFSYDSIAAGFLGGWYSPDGVVTNLAMISTFAGQLNSVDNPIDNRRSDENAPESAERLRKFVQQIRQAGRLTTQVQASTGPAGNTPANDDDFSQNRPAFPWLAQEMFGVMCSESANPTDVTTVGKTAEHYGKLVPGEGQFRTWQSSACSHWPMRGKNIYTGRFDAKTSNGVLIVSNEFDTATPHEQGGKVLHRILPGSRLVTVERGYGHGAMFYSKCARDQISGYIQSGTLPAENQTCSQDAPLFP